MAEHSLITRKEWRRIPKVEQRRIIAELVRVQLMRRPATQRNEAVARGLRAQMSDLMERSSRLAVQLRGGTLQWAVLCWPDRDTFAGIKMTSLLIITNGRKVRTEPYQMLETWKQSFHRRTIAALPIADRGALEPLRRVGFGLEFVILRGDVAKSLKRLKAKPGSAMASDIGVATVRSVAALKDIRRLKLKEFRRNPQYGWMCKDRAYLNLEMKRIWEDIAAKRRNHFVFAKGGKIVGYFAFTPGPKPKVSPAGVEIVLDESVQGQGLSHVAYLHMLSALKKLGAPTFQGGTSHPAVMRMARKMGRKPIALFFRWQTFDNHRVISKFLRDHL